MHEHLDEVGIINMNARLYDPVVGRFLQADNVIQDPDNLQNINRYGYVLNNPLKYTDPSGNEYGENDPNPYEQDEGQVEYIPGVGWEYYDQSLHYWEWFDDGTWSQVVDVVTYNSHENDPNDDDETYTLKNNTDDIIWVKPEQNDEEPWPLYPGMSTDEAIDGFTHPDHRDEVYKVPTGESIDVSIDVNNTSDLNTDDGVFMKENSGLLDAFDVPLEFLNDVIDNDKLGGWINIDDLHDNNDFGWDSVFQHTP